MANVVSVNVGLPAQVPWRGKSVRTAIWKRPVEGRVFAGRLNLAGDAQADLAGHGGEQRAVRAGDHRDQGDAAVQGDRAGQLDQGDVIVRGVGVVVGVLDELDGAAALLGLPESDARRPLGRSAEVSGSVVPAPFRTVQRCFACPDEICADSGSARLSRRAAAAAR